MNDYYTYLLIDPTTNKPFYVGKGRAYRMTKHERQVKLGIVPNNNRFLFNKIKKILRSGKFIKYKIPIKNVDENTSFKWEEKFIKLLRKKGYNLCNVSDGGKATKGNLGKHHSIETRMKWSKLRRGMFTHKWFIEKYGKEGNELFKKRNEKISSLMKGKPKPPITEETRNKLILSHMGKKQSLQTRLKRSKSMVGKFVGWHHSKETKTKISLSRKGISPWIKGRKHTKESKQKMKESHIKFYSFVSPSGNITKITCLKDFCKDNKLNYGNMSSLSTGKRKSCQGWKLQ